MNKEEKDELYKRYLESGLSIKEFALANDVSIYCMKGIVSYRKRFKEDNHDGFINVIKSIESKEVIHDNKDCMEADIIFAYSSNRALIIDIMVGLSRDENIYEIHSDGFNKVVSDGTNE